MTTTPSSSQDRSGFMPHVEGARALAVALVVVYHVFTEQTAGAVDVFFVLTGLLVVSSLLRRVDRGFAGVRDFLKGLFLRLAPVSLIVLLFTYLGALIFLPPVGINSVHREIIASALYFENWQLAIQGSDYLDRVEPPSPVLHFWAMSVQMQFYLATAIIFAVLAGIGLRQKGFSSYRSTLTVLFAAIFVVSFIYGVYVTYFGDQAWAYFDTFARAWEFSMGALLALALSRWPNLAIPPAWAWVGVAGFLAAGSIVAPVAPYPGFGALVPTISTVLIILAGRHQKSGLGTAFLSSKPMVSLGGVAYTLYLVHWPILIFYREAVSAEVSLPRALAIIAVSTAVAYWLRWVVEKPLLGAKYGKEATRTLAITAVPLAVLTVGLPSWSIAHNNTAVSVGDFVGTPSVVPSESRGVDTSSTTIDPSQVIPPFEQVRGSRPPVYSDVAANGATCMADEDQRESYAWCLYGEPDNFAHTVALVGASHSAHWLPALQEVASLRNWRIVTLVASDCNFVSVHPSRSRYENCDIVSEAMLSGLLEIRPDAVFTVANEGEEVVPGPERIQPWQALAQANIPVIALRDNPWFDIDPSRCLSENLDDPMACATPRDDVLAVNFSLGDAPDNVSLIDLTDEWCGPEYCPAILDNTLLWRDSDHFTVEFSRLLGSALNAKLEGVFRGGDTTADNDAVLRLLNAP